MKSIAVGSVSILSKALPLSSGFTLEEACVTAGNVPRAAKIIRLRTKEPLAQTIFESTSIPIRGSFCGDDPDC
jgi:hypothetical protein